MSVCGVGLRFTVLTIGGLGTSLWSFAALAQPQAPAEPVASSTGVPSAAPPASSAEPTSEPPPTESTGAEPTLSPSAKGSDDALFEALTSNDTAKSTAAAHTLESKVWGGDKTAFATANDAALLKEEERLDQLQTMYRGARSVFGGEHVLLTAILATGKRCADEGANRGNIFKCSTKESSSGLAGLVVVPIWGVGGGHGSDWWPVVSTDSEAEGYRHFEQEFRTLRKGLERRMQLPNNDDANPQVLQRRLDRVVDAFEAVLERYSTDGDEIDEYEDINRLRGCLATIVQASTLPEESESEKPEPNEAKPNEAKPNEAKPNEAKPNEAKPNEAKPNEAKPNESSATTSSAFENPQAACDAGVKRTTAGDATEVRGWTLTQKLYLVNALWREHDLLVQAEPMRRHNFLFGPLAGVAITGASGDLLYGFGIEAGHKSAFRVTLSGGLRSSMTGEPYTLGFNNAGWWAGIGLSGQLAEGVINAAFGLDRYMSGTEEQP